jgi:hypothetical protein
MGIDAPYDCPSIHEAAYFEALNHKWLESEKSGFDVGDVVFFEWYRRFWAKYLRYRRLEHVNGKCHWREFAKESFGSLTQWDSVNPLLLDNIIDRICEGYENLDLVNWAYDWNLPVDEVIEILERLDVNSTRFEPQAPADSHCGNRIAV